MQINEVLTLHFILDTGAAEVNIPADVALTLLRTGTIKDPSQIAEAAQAFQAAYQADPTDVEIINNLGDAYQRLYNLQAAEPLLLLALVFAPGRANAWANLGHTYAKQGQHSAAVACYANAYRFSRNQDATRQLFQQWAEGEEYGVRETAQQTLQLPLVQAGKP